jgi:cell division protein FtsI (penicillin-binding protein 3)
VLAKSSNIGTLSRRSPKMQRPELYTYLRKFGLGTRTGVQGYAEQAGTVPPPSSWIDITRDNIAFGQGSRSTRVQMAAAINPIANGGYRVRRACSRASGHAVRRVGPTSAPRTE